MIIIDVRTPQEYKIQHHNDALNIPVEELLAGNVPDYPLDSKIKLYCRSGARAERAKNVLIENGFTNVTNLGGIDSIE